MSGSISSIFTVVLIRSPETAWRTYQVLPEAGAGEILENPFNLPWSAFTGVAGMPGETAFYSTHLYGKFKKGETIFISTAAGAVGSRIRDWGHLGL